MLLRLRLSRCSSRSHRARPPRPFILCERMIGTIRRECLDFIIAIDEGTFARSSEMGYALQSGAPARKPATRHP